MKRQTDCGWGGEGWARGERENFFKFFIIFLRSRVAKDYIMNVVPHKEGWKATMTTKLWRFSFFL